MGKQQTPISLTPFKPLKISDKNCIQPCVVACICSLGYLGELGDSSEL